MSGIPGIGGKGVTITVTVWVCTVICLPFILLRLYTRRYLRGGVGSDDYCLIVDWILFVLYTSFLTVACYYGMGQHARNLDVDRQSNAVLYLLCGQVAGSLVIGLGKVVVAVFLLRILVRKWHKWFLWICIATISILSILTCITVFAQCTPAESIWNPRLAYKRKCHLSLATMAFIVCSYAVFLDFALAIFPWIALRRLNMKRKERITICASLSLGVFAGICGIFRTAGLGALYDAQDYVYTTSNPAIWTAAEASITIICVSLPVLRPLWIKVRRKMNPDAGNDAQRPPRRFGLGSLLERGALSTGPRPSGVDHDSLPSEYVSTVDVEQTHASSRDDGDENTLVHDSRDTGESVQKERAPE